MPSDKASTPFSTKDGLIPGEAPVSGARNFNKESRPQATTPETPGAGTPGFRPERAQVAGSPEERQAKQIPATGITTRADPGVASKSIGASNPNRAPFRVSTPTVKAKRG